MTPNCFTNRVALITGAAQGIGLEISRRFAELGATVILADMNQERGEAAAASIKNSEFVPVDLRKESEIQKMVNIAVQQYRRVDFLINNARPKLSLYDYAESFSEWDLALDVLLKAPALACRYVMPVMEKNGGGVILNIGSTNAFTISHQPAAYHAAKAGLDHLTRYLAQHFAAKGIRVNAICPGLVDIDDNGASLTSKPMNHDIVESIVPGKRAARPEEIADLASYLCSEGCPYLTGQSIIVDGGLLGVDHFHAARQSYICAQNQKKS
ncbi:MAG: SDR family oxidoreductase [Candidatus Hinthialibacter antarcticus]|nr:SDR family oxidoreductase [Candidatus Hinthialibacter antarcticus]